jgi:hypothetical protein
MTERDDDAGQDDQKVTSENKTKVMVRDGNEHLAMNAQTSNKREKMTKRIANEQARV